MPLPRSNLLAHQVAGLAATPGSFARGRAVFETNCGKCHKFDGKGAEAAEDGIECCKDS